MKLPFYIAKRYLVAKKSHNLINIVTWISIVSVGVAAFAMIFVLSVFNGFDKVISAKIHQMSPDLRITASSKTIDLRTFPFEKIKKVESVGHAFPSITEDALFKNHDKQQIGKVKGVPDDYNSIRRIKGTIVNDSTFILKNDKVNFALLGAGVAYYLGINAYNPYSVIQVYVPRRGNASSFNLENSFNSGRLYVDAVFVTQQDIDESLVLAPFNWLSNLVGYDSLATEIEIFTIENADLDKVKKNIKEVLGDEFKVHDQYEQQDTLYKMMRSEKFAVYLILTFILLMATFNVVASLSMLIIDKRKDIKTLQALGADKRLIRKLFHNEGTLISIVGGLFGLVLGIVAVMLQEKYGLIKLGGGDGNYIVDAYPVALNMNDIGLVFATIVIIGGIASLLTVRQSLRKFHEIYSR